MIRTLTALALALVATTAHAQPAPWAAPLAGAWTLAGVSEGDPVCGVTLGKEQTIGGAVLEVSAACRRNYDFEDVAAWSLRGRDIVFIDALRKTRFVFARGQDGTYNATQPKDLGAYLERGAPDKPASIRALFDETGTFTLSGPNKAAPCGFAVTATGATGGALEQAGRCAAPWKGKGWRRWSYANNQLKLLDAKGAAILTLRRGDAYTFTADTPNGPIFFGPGVIDGSEMLDAPARR
jgi:hypothetical protein